MSLNKYFSVRMSVKKNDLLIASRSLNDLIEYKRKHKLNRIRFINFILHKKTFFFQFFFNDFCCLLKKYFEDFFSSFFSCKFFKIYIDHDIKNIRHAFSKNRGKNFFLNNYSNECLLLISNDFFSSFISVLFGNHKYCLFQNYDNKNLTTNEIKILEVFFKKIFSMCNKTFFYNMMLPIVNNGRCFDLNNFLKHYISNVSYVCLIFKICFHHAHDELKFYFPMNILLNIINTKYI